MFKHGNSTLSVVQKYKNLQWLQKGKSSVKMLVEFRILDINK